MIEFEPDDWDWVMGELAHLFHASFAAQKRMCDHDPETCAAIVLFFHRKYRDEWKLLT
jgi:hypothetical protein